jgi:plastocyanin
MPLLLIAALTLLVAVVPPAPAPGAGRQAPGNIRGRVAVPEAVLRAARPAVASLGHSSHPPIDRRTVVVFLETTPELRAEAPPPTRARLDQRNERFEPHVLAITTGSTVEFPNNDSTYHNVFSFSRARTFDLGRYKPGRTGTVRFDRPGVVPVFCDIHSHMSAYILVFDHPYFAVSDASGRYAIAGVPPGSHALSVWSEVGRAASRRVTLAAGGTVEADFTVGRDAP